MTGLFKLCKSLALNISFIILFLINSQNAFAACEDIIIENDIKDVAFANTATLESTRLSCEGWYDAPGLAHEALVLVNEWGSESLAKSQISPVFGISRVVSLFGENFLFYNAEGQDHYIWQTETYSIHVFGDDDFAAELCNGFECLVEEYNDVFENDLDDIELSLSCYEWETQTVLGISSKVCTQFDENDVYNLGKKPFLYCNRDADCPGEGNWIISDKDDSNPAIRTLQAYYKFSCRNKLCQLADEMEDECSSTVSCAIGSCDIESTPNRCVGCLSNEDCSEDSYCGNKQCIKLNCGDTEFAANHSCFPLVCKENEIKANHKCVPCEVDEFEQNNQCVKLSCDFDEKAENHECVKLECGYTETIRDHSCVKLNCGFLNVPKNHKCVFDVKTFLWFTIAPSMIIFLIFVIWKIRKR